MRWKVKEPPFAIKRFALLPTKLLSDAGWVWLEHYWEGAINTPYGAAIYRHETMEKVHDWCNVPLPKQDNVKEQPHD